MVKFLFSVHTITEAEQSNRQGGSQGGGSSSQVIWPGAPWCSPATVLVGHDLQYKQTSSINQSFNQYDKMQANKLKDKHDRKYIK